MKLLKALWSKVYTHKRAPVVAGVILTCLLAILLFYVLNSPKTYYIAYIGRYERQEFEKLHELALERYIDELNAKLGKVRLKLKTFSNEMSAQGSRKIYEQLANDDAFIVVIDNTWAEDFQPMASFILEHKIPVIAINADKQGTDFQRHVVFLGHDDTVPQHVVSFSKNILKNDETIFITEENYPLKDKFRKEFEGTPTKLTWLSVSSSFVHTSERETLFQSLDAKFNEMSQRNERPTVVLNTHGRWGAEIINYIEAKHKGVTIVGGPYIITSSRANQFGLNSNGNSLIMLTTPSYAVPKKVYLDLKQMSKDEPKVFSRMNVQLFVTRCLDAVSIIGEVFLDGSHQAPRTAISKADFSKFFQEKLAGKRHKGEHDIYEFDNELLLVSEKIFEEHSKGQIFPYPKQLNTRAEVIPNVYFGFDIINISNINADDRTFHADFFYWLKFNEKYRAIAESIHFRNENKHEGQPEPLIKRENKDEETVYQLFKKSADFSMDVDFRKYPFESQELTIEMDLIYSGDSLQHPEDRLRISLDPESIARSKEKAAELNLDEWNNKDFYVTVENFVGSSLLGDPGQANKLPSRLKTVSVRVPIKRRWGSQFVTIILPLVMMGAAAIALLWVKDHSFANIGGAAIGIFLSIVTYSIAFADITPRSSVLTIADMLYYGTFFTIFLVFLKVIIRESSERAQGWMNANANWIGVTTAAAYGLMVTIIIFYRFI